MNNNEKILTITYFYGTKGCCPAEWADDKIDTMCKLEKNTILLTSIFSKKNTSNKVIHYRVPSLSIQDFRHELGEIKNENMQIPTDGTGALLTSAQLDNYSPYNEPVYDIQPIYMAQLIQYVDGYPLTQFYTAYWNE